MLAVRDVLSTGRGTTWLYITCSCRRGLSQPRSPWSCKISGLRQKFKNSSNFEKTIAINTLVLVGYVKGPNLRLAGNCPDWPCATLRRMPGKPLTHALHEALRNRGERSKQCLDRSINHQEICREPRAEMIVYRRAERLLTSELQVITISAGIMLIQEPFRLYSS